MAKKILIGVPHSNDREIDVLCSYLAKKRFSTVGLEVCLDYEEKKRNPDIDGYFYTLGRRLEDLGKKKLFL